MAAVCKKKKALPTKSVNPFKTPDVVVNIKFKAK